jgi:uncharacterized protein YdcH (DUF465 family)
MIAEKLKAIDERFDHFYDEHNPRDKQLKAMSEVLRAMHAQLENLAAKVNKKKGIGGAGHEGGTGDIGEAAGGAVG